MSVEAYASSEDGAIEWAWDSLCFWSRRVDEARAAGSVEELMFALGEIGAFKSVVTLLRGSHYVRERMSAAARAGDAWPTGAVNGADTMQELARITMRAALKR